MKVYAGMDPTIPLGDVAAYARRVEAMGYDGLQVAETVHDGLALALLALEHTERIIVRTSVILAFVRSPMLTAYSAWDLAAMSNGRFELGLQFVVPLALERQLRFRPFERPRSRVPHRGIDGFVGVRLVRVGFGHRRSFRWIHGSIRGTGSSARVDELQRLTRG